MRPRCSHRREKARACVFLLVGLGGEADKGQFGLFPFVFTDFVFFKPFILSLSNGHPKQGQMEDSFQNNEDKITKFKK